MSQKAGCGGREFESVRQKDLKPRGTGGIRIPTRDLSGLARVWAGARPYVFGSPGNSCGVECSGAFGRPPAWGNGTRISGQTEKRSGADAAGIQPGSRLFGGAKSAMF